jgi:CheY-like chemotaxis protein
MDGYLSEGRKGKMKENFPTYKILVVDDEELIRRLLTTILSKQGQECETTSKGFEALDK